MIDDLEARAREFLANEDGVLGDVYQIMAAFARRLVAESRAGVLREIERLTYDPQGDPWMCIAAVHQFAADALAAESEPGALPKIARAVRFGGETQP